jgi:hypothetical protein
MQENTKNTKDNQGNKKVGDNKDKDTNDNKNKINNRKK